MAQQSLVTSLISRGVTCDADNLVDYQSDSTSTHTNCLIQLLKSGWLRAFVSTEARILQRLVYLSSGYFQKFSKFPLQLQPLAPWSDLASLVSGRRILQRYNLLSTAFFTAVDLTVKPKHSSPLTSSNYLINKEFSVSSAPEVGRIIDRS